MQPPMDADGRRRPSFRIGVHRRASAVAFRSFCGPEVFALSLPVPMLLAVAWGLAGPAVLWAAIRAARRGDTDAHGALMAVAVAIQVAIIVLFVAWPDPSPRLSRLRQTAFFRFVHLPVVYITVAGIAWQLTSRAVARLRRAHQRTGPWVIGAWLASFLTGLVNFWYLYLAEQ